MRCGSHSSTFEPPTNSPCMWLQEATSFPFFSVRRFINVEELFTRRQTPARLDHVRQGTPLPPMYCARSHYCSVLLCWPNKRHMIESTSLPASWLLVSIICSIIIIMILASFYGIRWADSFWCFFSSQSFDKFFFISPTKQRHSSLSLFAISIAKLLVFLHYWAVLLARKKNNA